MNNIGENIKKFRKQRGLSQDELANQILDEEGKPLSRVTITRYENEREPSIEILRKIASALKVSIVELLTEDTYEAEESMMIDLLIEKTLTGIMEWKSLQTIALDIASKSLFEHIIGSLPPTIGYLNLRTSDSFYCNFNGIDYLLITYIEGKKELLIDTREDNNFLTFEDNLDGVLNRLSEVAKNAKSVTHRRGISKVLDSLSGSNNKDK